MADLLYPLLRYRKLVAICVGVFWILTALAVFVPARKYEAAMVVAAVPSSQGSALPTGFAALLASGQVGGVQSTPYFIAKILYLKSVLYQVASSPSTSHPGASIIERVKDEPLSDISRSDIERQMKKMLATDVDKQTGLLTIGVTCKDSALAREIVSRVVDLGGQAFVRAAQAQATEQRRSQEVRVDSAEKRLRSLEEQMLAFVSSNREFTPYSIASVRRQRLERELNNAQAVYAQAVADRERAVAQELEDTPAVVVVDPVPSELTPVPRQTVLKFFVGTLLGLIVAAVLVWLRVQPTDRVVDAEDRRQGIADPGRQLEAVIHPASDGGTTSSASRPREHGF